MKEQKRLVKYNEEEQGQYDVISKRLRTMSDMRRQKLKILNNLTIEERYLQNQMDHIAYIGEVPTRHEWKSRIKGTQSRTKLHKLVSLVIGENLGPTIKAYNSEYDSIEALGRPLTNVVRRTNEIEDLYKLGDVSDASHEALIQGTVFIEEIYDTTENERNKGIFDPTNLELMAKSMTKEKTQVVRIYKKVLEGLSVFLGSLNEAGIQEQPDLAIRTVMNWDEAKGVYGNWERWKYVEAMKGKKKEELASIYDPQYMLKQLDTDNENVEVVRYMRKNPQTYQIYLNGVQMLPVNTGFPWGYNKYNMVSRALYPVAISFPYGSSIYDMTRTDQGVLDMLVNLDIDSKRQLLEPAVSIINKNAQAINLFKPSSVHRGISPEDIKILSPQTGMNNSAWQTINHFNLELDKMFNPTMMGQPLTGEHSATEVNEMQKSALKILGYLYLAIEGVVKDCGWLRIHNIIANCISYEGKGVKSYNDGLRNEILPAFQEYLIENVLLDDGKRGKMKVRFIPKEYQEKVLRTEAVIGDEDLAAAEKLGFNRIETLLLKKKKAFGDIYEEILIDPNLLQSLEWYFQVLVEPMTKNTTAFERAEYREMMTDAVNLFGPESINLELAKSNFTKIHKTSDEFFKNNETPQVQNVANQIPNTSAVAGGDGNVVSKQQGKTPEMSNQLMASVKRQAG